MTRIDFYLFWEVSIGRYIEAWFLEVGSLMTFSSSGSSGSGESSIVSVTSDDEFKNPQRGVGRNQRCRLL